MNQECLVCFEIKDCLSFPCCDNHFTICTSCLVKCSKICPQCRTPFNVDYHTTITNTNKCSRWKNYFWIACIIFTFNLIITNLVLIDNRNKCTTQPCYNVPFCKDTEKCIDSLHTCICNLEHSDILWFNIITIIVLYFPTIKILRDNFMIFIDDIVVNTKMYIIVGIMYSSISIIYIIVNHIFENYQNNNYEIAFYHSWIGIGLFLYFGLPLGILIIMGSLGCLLNIIYYTCTIDCCTITDCCYEQHIEEIPVNIIALTEARHGLPQRVSV